MEDVFFPHVSTWPKWARRSFVILAPVTVPLYILGWVVYLVGCAVYAFFTWLSLTWA